ncbi:hypothetical protein HYALB_00005277 [Hymenoscyphus albidus]|uniref:Polyketide synthase n=1 Tax=Hymenoscyphus albidus TaxID=595503 RepID=A0A9N9Q0V4_9HELO|nr:hypothetical protein HYALB_00005277 [Hymenoscyphus albidus]
MPSTSNPLHVPVAIVGMACRFPGDATSPSKFWKLLQNGKDAYYATTNRYNADAFYHPNAANRQNVLATKGGHFLKQDPYAFDAAFFNITAAEAMSFDPKQRTAMEVVYEALENAGKPLSRVAGTQTACYIGSSMSYYRDAVVRDFGHSPKYHILGTCEEMISNRVSHFLDIHGPSATIHTACSSSLVATHLGCQSLQSGDSEMALVGGVGPFESVRQNSGGYGRGEGCGILVLKRLDRAMEDGDSIRGVIRASGVNSDGWTQGVTMPSSEAQAALIKYVYTSHGLDYGSTQYVEAHGTGTKAGDPQEAGAIHRTIGQGATKSRKLWIGSVKPNGVLAMENGLIPPNIHFTEANSAIPLDEWNMAVPTKLTPWPITQGERRMSVSGFGMGGTNGHVVLESFTPGRRKLINGTLSIGHHAHNPNFQTNRHSKKRLFLISSQDQAGFKRVGDSLVEHLDSLGPVASTPEYLANLAHTFAVARSGLSWRASILAESVAELRDKLSTEPGANATRAASSGSRIGFVFTGQGAQWARMGLELQDRPVFKESIAKSAKVLESLGCEWDIIAELAKGNDESRLSIPLLSQPICTILQVALVDELRFLGIMPLKVIGHSSGEIAAAYAIGALSHEDAVAIAYFSGKVSAGLTNLKGGMMAVGSSPEEAQKLILDAKLTTGTVTVACVNSPSSVTLSGDVAALEELRAILDERGVFARRLKVEVAYHSSHMNSAMAEYFSLISHIQPEKSSPGQPIQISSVMGVEVDSELLGHYYWVRNLISPVLFADAIKEMVMPSDGDGKNTIDLLLKIGPHSALNGPIEQTLAHHGIKNVAYTSALIRNENSLDSILKLASELSLQGVSFDVQKANGDSNCKLLTALPPYPWNHSKSFRADSRIHRELINQEFPTRSLIGAQLPAMAENSYEWRSFIRLSEEPWLRGHTVGTIVLFPGAGIFSIVLEATQQLVDKAKTARAFRLRDVNLFAAMALVEDQATEVIIHLRSHLVATTGSTQTTWWEFTVSSCVGTGQMRDNARGLVTIDYNEIQSQQMDVEDAMIPSWTYGELFQGVENCHPGYGKTVFDIRLVDIGETFSKGQLARPFLMNAASLDAVFQSWLGATYKNGAFEFDKPFVPTAIGELEISVDIPADADYVMPGFCRAEGYGFNELSADIALFDKDMTKVFLSVKDFRTSELEMESGKPDGESVEVDPADITSEVKWNYNINMLDTHQISQIMSRFPAQGRLTELVRMILHVNPEIAVTELISEANDRIKASVAQLPDGAFLPSRVRYAIPITIPGDGAKFQCLDGAGSTLPVNEASADLLIVSLGASDSETLGSLLLSASQQLMKREAYIIVTANNNATASSLVDRGFNIVSNIDDHNSLALYIHQEPNPEVLSQQPSDQEVVIIQPATATAVSGEFSAVFYKSLQHQGYKVLSKSWNDGITASDVKGKIIVSLLELEQPLLDRLYEHDFEGLRTIVLNSERILWISAGENPALGMVDGFARCMMSENAGIKFQLLHLTATTGLKDGPSLVTRILSTNSVDNEYRELDSILQVARIFKNHKQNESIRHHLEDSTRLESLAEGDEALRLTIAKPGLLDTLKFVSDERMLPSLNEFEVEIQFRDIMACMALIPVKALGQEASGVIARTGSKVTDFKVGDRVSTISVGIHATRIRVDQRGLASIPDSLSFEDAAAVGVVHMTAYYAFSCVARLQKGQSVLIHAAAGAKHLGLTIYATVGTEDKRELIVKEYGIPDEHIFHLRDASFGINRVTGGRGVDCILNFLSGELLRASWGCLATFGNFIEIGLRDITNNMRLDMRPFRKSTTFTFINNHTLFEEDPDAFYDVFHKTFKLTEEGILRPPSSVMVYPVGQVKDAFRTMQQGKHRGKLVLSFADDSRAPIQRKAKDLLKLDPKATYLFVGGLGGLGRSLAKQFVASGAQNIAFLSRSGGTTLQVKAVIAELSAMGVQIKAYSCDIADSSSFQAAMAECAQDLPPVKGVIQMAMILRNIVQGTWNLHEYFNRELPLDFMIFYSSSSGIYGYPSQAQYAAGNTYQDALAHYRRSQGLKAISVNLGIMRDVSVFAESGTSGNIKIWEEVLGIREPAFHALMKSLINQQMGDIRSDCPVQVCTGLGTADIMAAHGLAKPGYFEDPRFGPLAVTSLGITGSAETQGSSESLAARLHKATSMDEATEIIKEALVNKIADILQMPASEVDPSRALYRYGVDSLVALEVRNWITREMKANMALLEILAAVPIESFAAKIAEKSKLVTVL